MHYTREQIQILKKDYDNMFDSIIIKLEARKIMYKTISTSARAGKLAIFGGVAVLGLASIALCGQVIKNTTGLDPFAIKPMTGFSMMAFPAAIMSEFMILNKANDKMQPFIEKIDSRMEQLTVACDVLIKYFNTLKGYLNYNDFDFQQVIFQFADFYQSTIEKKELISYNIVENLISDDIKYADIVEKREIERKIEKLRRNIDLNKILRKEWKTIYEQFNIFYTNSKNLYYQSNFRRNSY